MYLHSCRIRNFRRLRDVRIDFQDDISIFVGPNNSGKTSAAHALQMFLTEQHRHFAIHDFHCESWREFNAAGESKTAGNPLPTISLDLWFEIDKEDLHRVLPLLPSLLWKGSKVGLRIVYAPRNDADLWSTMQKRRPVPPQKRRAIRETGVKARMRAQLKRAWKSRLGRRA
jgi:predicted ATP-dependent endonuclease of OLD family